MQQVTQQIHQAMERDLNGDLKSVPSRNQKETMNAACLCVVTIFNLTAVLG